MTDSDQPDRAERLYTRKQMGDACEMLVAAELTLAGIPALKAPDNWPGYDVIAQPPDRESPLRISVKSRTYKEGPAFVQYMKDDTFDWLAIVLLNCPGDQARRVYLLPRAIADLTARRNDPAAKNSDNRYWRINEIAKRFSEFEDNFSLLPAGRANAIASL